MTAETSGAPARGYTNWVVASLTDRDALPAAPRDLIAFWLLP